MAVIPTITPQTLSIRQLVDNPSGKGSAYLAKRTMIKQGLNLTFIKILGKYRKQFMAVPYVYNDGRILFHVKVPSEIWSINKITYDVLIEINPGKGDKRYAMRDAKFFSNSPSFIFTYTYVFNKSDLLIDKFKTKLPYEALNNAPVMRNPVMSLGWEKSLYCACRYLLDGFCLTDSYILKYQKPINSITENNIYVNIADPTKLISIYQHAQYLHRKTHRKPLTANEIKRRDKIKQDYVEDQRDNKPTIKKGILTITPRSKITARKAKKTLLGPSNSKTKQVSYNKITKPKTSTLKSSKNKSVNGSIKPKKSI